MSKIVSLTTISFMLLISFVLIDQVILEHQVAGALLNGPIQCFLEGEN